MPYPHHRRSLTDWASDITNLSILWTLQATSFRTAINTYCWDPPYGAFKDSATLTILHPQDANSMSLLFGVPTSTNQSESISAHLLANWSPIGPISPELPSNISPFITSFELLSHLSIHQTQRALDLIRASWGWYLSYPNGTNNTMIEGYLANGSFAYRSNRGYDYDVSYVSHNHGWSTGPTYALRNYVLGLGVTGPAGGEWRLAPQFGDLRDVEGGFVTPLVVFGLIG